LSESFDGSVCVDCVMVIANGDTSGISDVGAWEAGVAALDACEGGRFTVVLACDDQCEGWFSHSRCDYCGSTLGGERHPVNFIEI
jgi:hypothetical protein